MIRVVTDTTSSLTLEQYRRYGITAVPLYVRRDEVIKKELYELSYEEFYREQRAGVKFFTSQPDPQSFLEVFRQIIEAGDEVVCVTISSKISGTINAANLAKELLASDGITIFDSQESGINQAAMAIRAAEMAGAGESRATITAALEAMRARKRVFFVVETLRYLYEGGRLNGIQALIGSIIQLKPIVWFDNAGVMTSLEKVRTLKAAKARSLELIREQAKLGVEQVGLHYGDNLEEAKEFAGQFEEIVEMPVPLVQVSPVIAVHTGPDLLGPCIITKKV